MPPVRVCLFEDGVETLEPLTLTRPAFDLWCGRTTLAAKQLLFSACTMDAMGVLVRPHLADLYRLQNPGVPVNDWEWLRAGPTILVNGRWLPDQSAGVQVERPSVGLTGEEVAYVFAFPDDLQTCSFDTLPDRLHHWRKTLPCHNAGGRLMDYPWELVDQNAQQLCRDFQPVEASPSRSLPLSLVGPPDQIVIDPSARIDPMVVADTTAGPIVIDRKAVITAFTRLEGPCYIGPESHLFGAKIRGGTTLGPMCRIGGEIEASIVQGYSNKYHDGFLGHSYLGEWVNLGAGTQNSDLRNDYGPVTVTINGRAIDTGLTKVGCFIGDHTKTGLGTLLNTGSNIGAFCNLLPAGPLAPKYVPSFTSWWNGVLRENEGCNKLLATAQEVMQRRGCTLSEAHIALYNQLFQHTQPERRRLCRHLDQPQLRRSA